ncbi:MAG: ABC transporter permease [Bryobacteraceae bacterium]|nr:ABC transporter permease [Bryobacteraceae bacterium]MDW8379233.1 ABC transporter permease [Bryobacterales bacterium]
MICYRRTKAIAKKEFLHVLRDPRSLYLALAIPMLLLVLFGYALSLDVDQIPLAVFDHDDSGESRELIRRFTASPFFQFKARVESYREIEAGFRRGGALAALVVPTDFSRKLKQGETVAIQFLLDGSDSNTASIALGYAKALVSSYSSQLRTAWQVRKGAGEIKPPVELELRVIYNEELKSKNYIVPGLIAVILMIIAALLTSLCIAREWENGTMEELLSTPLRPAELVLGKLAAYFALGFVDMLTAVTAGIFIFGVPMRGSVWLLFLSACVFLFGALCWGIFLSATMRNQLQAFQAGLLSSFLPAFLLSGFVYSLEQMPLIPRLLSYIVPARYFVALMKGIFQKGVGLEVLWLELVFLVVYAGIVFVLTTRKLKEKLA